MNIRRKIDDATKGTIMNGILLHAIYLYLFAKFRFRDILLGRYKGNPISFDGFYKINVEPVSIPPFWYSCHVGKRHRRDRITGEYENEVMKRISQLVSEDDTFWEVGAWRGWYSLALAPVVNEVVAFEAREHPTTKLRESVAINDYDNVMIENNVVKSIDTYNEQFGEPDIVLMDIEGWEYEVLESSLDTLRSVKPVFIIEVHGRGVGWSQKQITNARGNKETVNSPDRVNPEGVEELLEEHGYTVSTINIRRGTHRHILAKPEN